MATMSEIRRNAIESACREYARVMLAIGRPSGFSVNRVRRLIDYCLRKEYRAGEHQGALNPYC